jgi:hypothetical protein
MSANLKVVKFFIKNTPVGEVQDVLEDLSNILNTGHDFLNDKQVKEALREYYEHHR